MNDPLATYLHDHLAGSKFAIDLLERMRDQHAGEPLSQFAAALLVEVEQDRAVLQEITDRAGSDPSLLKEAAGWVGEKVSQLKLGRTADDFGTFEALEALALGILGKLALWRSLQAIAEINPRVSGADLERLAQRAQAQNALVEERRLQAARTVFRTGPK